MSQVCRVHFFNYLFIMYCQFFIGLLFIIVCAVCFTYLGALFSCVIISSSTCVLFVVPVDAVLLLLLFISHSCNFCIVGFFGAIVINNVAIFVCEHNSFVFFVCSCKPVYCLFYLIWHR